jgi:hypothetical protein
VELLISNRLIEGDRLRKGVQCAELCIVGRTFNFPQNSGPAAKKQLGPSQTFEDDEHLPKEPGV